MNETNKLFFYLNQKLEASINYEDLANLCFSLYCTLGILPKDLQSLQVTKDVLAAVFAKIAKERSILNHLISDSSKRKSFNYTNDKHWIDLIDNRFKYANWPNLIKANMLLGNIID